MGVFFQQQINHTTKLGIWKIEETDGFFKRKVPAHREVTHPHKRLQHLAGRYLLQYLFTDFPYELIKIADTNKPFLPDEEYHFSISHCGDYAAAIVSKESRVGVDIEIPAEKIVRIQDKFLNIEEKAIFSLQGLTLAWSSKEAVFKWYGDGGVDFKQEIHLLKQDSKNQSIKCWFKKTNRNLEVNYREFDQLVLTWVIN